MRDGPIDKTIPYRLTVRIVGHISLLMSLLTFPSAKSPQTSQPSNLSLDNVLLFSGDKHPAAEQVWSLL